MLLRHNSANLDEANCLQRSHSSRHRRSGSWVQPSSTDLTELSAHLQVLFNPFFRPNASSEDWKSMKGLRDCVWLGVSNTPRKF
jgi:hypothetical protein